MVHINVPELGSLCAFRIRSPQNLRRELLELSIAKRFGMNVRNVFLPVDLVDLYYSKIYLFAHVINNHQKMFAFLDIGGIVGGYCNDCGIILHDNCWHLEIKLKLVADGEDKNDVFDESVDSAHFRMSAGSRN